MASVPFRSTGKHIGCRNVWVLYENCVYHHFLIVILLLPLVEMFSDHLQILFSYPNDYFIHSDYLLTSTRHQYLPSHEIFKINQSVLNLQTPANKYNNSHK